MSSSTSSIAPQSSHAPVPTQTLSRDNTVLQAGRIDAAHELPAAAHFLPAANHSISMVRQRFYPAQLKRLVYSDLFSLAVSRKQRLTWSGWDRSLPRLYLPVEPLVRLLIEAVDGITRSVSQNDSIRSSINVRVHSQPIANSTLTIALDAEQWQCDDRFRGALNARWFRQSSQSHLWQRLARHCDSVGGWLSVASLPGGGTTLLINLPIDQPRALITSWLNRQMSAGQSGLFSARAHDDRFRVALYAIGRNQPETFEQLQAANIRLQSLANQTDFIYRTCPSRWIWVTLQPQLPTFLNTPAWQSQRLDCWNCAPDMAATLDLAVKVEHRFHQLMGTRIPTVDLRSPLQQTLGTHQLPKGPISLKRPNTRVDQAAQVSSASHLHNYAHAKTQHAKWRYPI